MGRGVPPRSGGNSQMKRAGMLVQTIVTYHTFLLALIIFGITSFIGNDSFSSKKCHVCAANIPLYAPMPRPHECFYAERPESVHTKSVNHLLTEAASF